MKNTIDTSYSINCTEEFIITTNKNTNSLIPKRGKKCDLASLIFKLWLNPFQVNADLIYVNIIWKKK